MVQYISDVILSLKSKVAGMVANAAKWQNQQVNVEELEGYIVQLDKIQIDIDAAETALQQKREAGRKLTEVVLQKIKQVDSFAVGIHFNETTKLAEYGIESRKGKSSKAVPTKAIITSVTDEANGDGFVVTFQKLVDADHYEVEKGVSPGAGDKVLAPPFPFLKSTSKTVVNDTEVEKGRRYFYRVRGVNATGVGEWSEAVSRVQ